MKNRALLIVLIAFACGQPPEFRPPPFGPQGPSNTRFFFPTGLAALPDGSLLVVNGNFNHAYDGGTLVSIKKAYLDSVYAKQLHCDTVDPVRHKQPDACFDDVAAHPGDVFGGAVMIGNYAGAVATNDTGDRAFVAARDTGQFSVIKINPDLSLECVGGPAKDDCRTGGLDLTAYDVDGPFAIVPGDFQASGAASQRVIYVASMTPHVDEITAGVAYTSAMVAAIDMADPSQVLFTMFAASRYVASGTGVGPMIYDPARRQLLMSGCFQRFLGSGAGEPGTGRCAGISNNYLRMLDVDASSSAAVQLFDLFGDVLSIETTAMIEADPDPVTHIPGTLWVTMRNPDVLVQVQLPPFPSVAPRVRRVIPLPVAPADLVLIPRPGRPDLIGVMAEKLGQLVIYDVGEEQIVAQVGRLGDSPFSLKVISNDGVNARLAASVFDSCSVALMEVPLDRPWAAELRGLLGKCP